ncbi:lipopolysaccharide assembly protein LapA domain-containing protein [Sporolactobacillus shoreicorticis]|uniref:Lipopolysaccharide assembly LapA domain-containing protein n=1 Tax=Sporolactobacillus shoreicorticis TaxID=1923877 RepID=A0ABW5S4N5_9BACL|nr:lipopolysaccharide assembly protein LapA domain-containing protein [Sporolactobacillus shoreicorticis]MCO7126404.1 lipopolysaccharide assembly protein LapA domain-containing protein [Sporolactobacillus shoreicorticis]
MKKQWRILLVLIFTLIIVLFSIANVETVGFSFLFGVVRLPLILVIIGSLLIGAVLIGLFTYSTIYKQRHRIGKLERELRRIIDLHPEDSERLKVDLSGEETSSESRTARRRSQK